MIIIGILHDKSKVVYPATRGIDLVFLLKIMSILLSCQMLFALGIITNPIFHALVRRLDKTRRSASTKLSV